MIKSELSLRRRPVEPRDRTKTSTVQIRVLVAGLELPRRALVALLETQPDLVVGGACSCEDVLQLIDNGSDYDILVIDNQVETETQRPPILEVLQSRPDFRILVISGSESTAFPTVDGGGIGKEGDKTRASALADYTVLALAEGAQGVIHADAGSKDLFRAVRRIAAGGEWVDAADARRLIDWLKHQDPEDRLTEREIEVARLVGEGLCNKEIARRLNIAEPTVKKHVGHILHKLNLKDRLQLGICVSKHYGFFHRH